MIIEYCKDNHTYYIIHTYIDNIRKSDIDSRLLISKIYIHMYLALIYRYRGNLWITFSAGVCRLRSNFRTSQSHLLLFFILFIFVLLFVVLVLHFVVCGALWVTPMSEKSRARQSKFNMFAKLNCFYRSRRTSHRMDICGLMDLLLHRKGDVFTDKIWDICMYMFLYYVAVHYHMTNIYISIPSYFLTIFVKNLMSE